MERSGGIVGCHYTMFPNGRVGRLPRGGDAAADALGQPHVAAAAASASASSVVLHRAGELRFLLRQSAPGGLFRRGGPSCSLRDQRVVVARVDASKEAVLVQREKVRGFPLLRQSALGGLAKKSAALMQSCSPPRLVWLRCWPGRHFFSLPRQFCFLSAEEGA